MENKSEKKFMTEIRLGNSLCLYWELGPRYYTTVYDYVLEMPPSTCFISEKRKNTLLSTNTFTEITLRHECSPVNLLHIFRTPFLKNASGRLLVKTSYNHICFLYFLFSVKRQKQPPELVYKKSCSEKFCKIHRKTLCRLLFLMKLKVLGLKFY